MLRRLLRSAIVFAVLVAAYNAYALWAVPQMEPQFITGPPKRLDPYEMGDPNESVNRYQLLLSNYFGKQHWSQQRAPKVIANSGQQVMLVFDEFKRRPGNGQNEDGSPTVLVDIDQIAILLFPTPPRLGINPPRDAVLFEAPGGAHLEFDDFRPEVGKIGKIIRGNFPGLIRIHSDMKAEGAEDDLIIETADMLMNTKRMYTKSPVRFRMGNNVGGGTGLEIHFLADEHAKSTDPGLKIAGIDHLEIPQDVAMRLELDTRSMLPGGKDANKKTAAVDAYATSPAVQVGDARPAAAPEPKPLVEVTCSGPFTFDFLSHKASLDRDVEVRQVNTNGPSDQLVCSRLDIAFAPKAQPGAANQPADKKQMDEIGHLEPISFVAEGHPVIATSPSRESQARGDRLQVMLKEQRIRISGGNSAQLVFGGNELRAPMIDYQHPAHDEGTHVGRFRATGPGVLHYVVDPKKPDQVLEAMWQTSVQLGREKGQPVLALDGRPKISLGTSGALTADQMRMYLRELEGKGDSGITIGTAKGKSATKIQLAPDRLFATGRVEIVSPKFTGRTQQLSTSFRLEPEAPTAAAVAPANSAPGGPPVSAGGNSPAPSPAGSSPSPPQNKNSTNPFNVIPGAESSDQTFYIDADQMQLEVFVKGKDAAPAALTCDGHVMLREVPRVQTPDQPIEIHGAQLTVTKMDTKTPHIVLHGAGSGNAIGTQVSTGGGGQLEKFAQLTGRGMTMFVDTVEADGGDSHVWSDGPGKATMLVTKNVTGQQSATPVPMDISWVNGFRFDGQTVVFKQNVVVAGMESTLHCDQLVGKLASRVKLGEKMNQSAMNMSEIECTGQVKIDNLTRDVNGITGHAIIELPRLAVNQQTGVITGDGPGVIRATRFGNGMAGLPGQPAAAQTVVPPNPAGNKLYFLRVDFRNGLDGNIYTRELTFHQQVRTIYGPVDSWEQELDPSRPETLPPETMKLTCEQLRLNEDPLAVRNAAASPANPADKRPVGPVQMTAQTDVRITGQTPQTGEFSVQANTASYDELKGTFILEGDGRTPARLYRRATNGQDAPPLEARRILYVPKTNATKVEGMRYLEITPGDIPKRDSQNPQRSPLPAK